MPVKVLLHIGMPKCGSSALQSYLSSPELEQVTQGRCGYAVLQDDGQLLSGKSLIHQARTEAYGYASSARTNIVTALNLQQKAAAKKKLCRLGKKHEWLILSCEAWGQTPQQFSEDCLFADPAFEVHVLAYVRPQIEWMNSAWWQWGAWTSLEARPWIDRERKKALWYSLLRQWAEKPWVKTLTVRLLDGDIIQDCMNHLGYQVSGQSRVNQSLPEIVLRLFQRHRHLRPGPHASAIDFVLGRCLSLDTKEAPWIMGPVIAKNLVEFFRKDNEQLVQMLSSQQREHMLSDSRWWQAERNRKGWLNHACIEAIDIDELEQFAVAAIKAVENLDAEVRQLRSRLFLYEPNLDL